ncbi:telomere length regulation protein-domain-containing protein [Aspergillus pseudodeflectus]|uniref:Telomere length regulation protein-domain-containing protein n=1 Tax=Aspergillus pseudodeflectus TaxID=176178 RepID=A0ABR4K5S2_9EURO
MDGLITEIKTINHSRDDILRAREDKSPKLGHETRDHGPRNVSSTGPASSANILSILRANPGQDELSRALSILDPFRKGEVAPDFDIRVPSPKTAQILNALVTITVPDHWDPLNTGSNGPSTGSMKLRAALLRCLSSVSGISCLVAQLRSLIAQARASSQQADASGSGIRIRHILEVTSALLEPKDFVLRLRADIDMFYKNDMQKQVAWKELLSLIAASRVLSTAAEALSLASESEFRRLSWLGNGSQYASWLGANICHMTSKLAATGQEEQWRALASLTGRALSLGYTDQVVKEIYSGLLVSQPLTEQYAALFDRLRWTEQLAVLESVFRDIEKKHLLMGSANGNTTASDQPVNATAALCSILLSKRSNLESQLIDWLSKGQGGSIQTPALRRALIVNLAYQKDRITTLLTKSLEQSADKIYIQHAPLRSQEANTQVILLAAGYLNRLDAGEMMSIGRTSVFLNAVSNRLAAASTRARFLGMLIGTAISQLIEEPGKAMRFDLEEMESTEAEWYLSLIRTEDSIGSLETIKLQENLAPRSSQKLDKGKTFTSNYQPFKKASQTATSKIVAIEEIGDSDEEEEEEEDEDLIPYEKPDEDPSDSDDDPTLVQRKKPTAPVYIRDLVAALRDTDNLDRHELAVAVAPALIRRKTGFGTELAEHIEELALVVVGLQEQRKLPRFHEQRLQSMIALIVSQPLKMAQWFTAVFFDGDLSQVQRSAVLTALGLSARELAGVGADDAIALGLPAISDSSFPSKKLPPSLEAIYSSDESPIAAITRGITQASLQPLAAEAADNLSGPNALKVRTFSSRMEVEKRRQQREAHRQKSTVKDLYKVLTEGFFYPLTGRFEIMMLQFTSSTAPSHNPFFVPHLLALFIQTLTLVLSTMGPHTPFLPSVTQQTLTFLLSLHARPVSEEPTILSALLSLFLAMIDMNVESGTSGEERLVTEFATQVMELREWAGEIFDRTPAVRDSSDPREQIRTLSAGVMVKLGEVMEGYQGRLMGVNSGFKY